MKNDRKLKQQKMNAALKAAADDYADKHGERPRGSALVNGAIDRRSPFDLLAEKEDALGVREPGALPLFDGAPEGPTIFDELNEFEAAYEREGKDAALLMLEAHFWLLDFIFAEGPHPAKVMRRLYAWVKKYRPTAIWDMGYRRLGDLLGETGANMQWRVDVMIDAYCRAKGINGVKMPWQKTQEACGKYSAVQHGNASRVGGKRAGKHKAKNQ